MVGLMVVGMVTACTSQRLSVVPQPVVVTVAASGVDTTVATSTSTTSTSSSTSTSTTSTVLTPPATTDPPAPGATGALREIRPASDIAAPPIPPDWTVESIGVSVLGRPITSWSRRVEGATRRVVVFGAIHGNEPASPPTVRSLVDIAYPPDVEVWLVPELNPDGVAAGTRWNANGVDLNRNFSWGWRADDGGPEPLSEPETRAAVGLVDRVAPDLVVWVHQPYGYVSSVGGSDDVFEQWWSVGSGLPVRDDVTQHGGGESWSHFHAGLDSMLIEIETWDATPAIVTAQRAGFERLIAEW